MLKNTLFFTNWQNSSFCYAWHGHAQYKDWHLLNLQCISKQYIPSINALVISISKQLFKPMTKLLVYRNHHDHWSQFLFHIKLILLTNTIHIVLGDSNMDFVTNDSNNLKQLIEGFCMYQAVSLPTCIPGASLLDHVYVGQPFLPIQNVHTATKGVCYSDHEAIQVVQ